MKNRGRAIRSACSGQMGMVRKTKIAMIEMAQASGIQLVPPSERDACHSTTFGTGQLILDALDAGAKDIILTVGGSATNDGGTGLLSALGAVLLDANQKVLPAGGLALSHLSKIDLTHFDSRIQHTRFLLAADVTNPLCGPNGASHIFGPQKVLPLLKSSYSIQPLPILPMSRHNF